MTAKYRPLGEYVRPLGEFAAHGEMIHQSVLDRRALADLHYAPPNLEAYLAHASPRVTTTTRTPRGVPCEALTR